MNILEEIKVRWCSDNLVFNNGFEIPDIPTTFFGWNEDINGGEIVADLGYKGDKSAKLTGSGSSRSSLSQTIDMSNIGECNLIISFAGKNNEIDNGACVVYQFIVGSGWEVLISTPVVSDSWDIVSLSGTVASNAILLKIVLLSPLITHSTNFDEIKIYYIDEQELDIDLIEDSSLSDIKQEIEDDLFTFKGDNFNLKIRNNHAEPGVYFDNQRFITDSKLFSLCIKVNLFYDGGTQPRFLTYFVDRKSCNRSANYDKDIINISAFELSGLMQDKGWFIGKYIYNETAEEGVFRFELTQPTILYEAGSSSDILSLILDDFKRLVVDHDIPISPDNVSKYVYSNLLSNETYEDYFDQISGEGDGKKLIWDYFIDKFSDRIFVLLISNTCSWPTGGETENIDFDLYEIGNGSNLKYIETITSRPDIDGEIRFAFVHQWDEPESPTAFVIYQIHFYAGEWRRSRWWYRYDESGYVFQYTTAQNQIITLGMAQDWTTYGVDENGNEHFGAANNYNFIKDYPISSNYPYYSGGIIGKIYTASEFIEEITNVGVLTYDIAWAAEYKFEVYRFPHYLQFGFSNITLAELLKELCVTQDAIWYFKYNNIGKLQLYMARRKAVGDPQVLDDVSPQNDFGGKKVRLLDINFDDIESRIYEQDVFRTKMFRDFYNDKYGGGKTEINFPDIFQHQLLELGQEVTLDSIEIPPSGIPISYLIKQIGWSIHLEKKRTKLTMFELGSV